MYACVWLRAYSCTCGFLHVFLCASLHLHTYAQSCVCMCVHAHVCQALMSLCSHISIHATTAWAPPLINFALPFKKAYHKFPIRFTSAPGVHKKAYLYWSPLPEIVFQREDISLCPSRIKGSSALQRVNHIYQSNTGARRHIEQSVSGAVGVNKRTHLAWTTLGCLDALIFVYWILDSVTFCQATPGLPFNWVWHVSRLRLTLPMYKHAVHPSQRKLWKIQSTNSREGLNQKVTKCSDIVKWYGAFGCTW